MLRLRSILTLHLSEKRGDLVGSHCVSQTPRWGAEVASMSGGQADAAQSLRGLYG